jgi:hypothetical protein
MNSATDPLADLPPASDPEAPASVGSATMEKDRTLRLMLRTETADGMVGEMTMVVAPDDPRYAGYVAHLGGMKPGDAKPIPPFPEPQIDPNSI